MREGLRIWINHTNQWKNHPRADQVKYWASAQPLSLNKAVEAIEKRGFVSKVDGGREFNPAKHKILPQPESWKPSSRKIVFSRPIEEIRFLSSVFFDRDDEKPGIIGDKCFEDVFTRVKSRRSED
jgi:hypothetical protein